ncbi:MAG: efflux RND transporter permease subunit, partial [Candidatus Goldbacteria bacterium]|nr:efflux RND transporter permease subunit [Candidatus Goldiibacteriota bacterium]
MIYFISKQKVLAILFSIFLTLTGVLFFVLSPKESLPEIKLGFIVVKTIYPNASPKEVEKLVTIPIEDALKNIKGIKEINSTSSEN